MISEIRLRVMAQDTVNRAKRHGYAPGSEKSKSYCLVEWNCFVAFNPEHDSEENRDAFLRFALAESGVIA